MRKATLTELDAAIRGSKGDVATLRIIEWELSHRSTNEAKRILSRLRTLFTGQAREGGGGAVQSSRDQASRSRAPWGGQAAAGTGYDGLRLLITEEAEVLAKWGLAPGLPTSVETRFLEIWEQLLSGTGECHGRSIDELRKTRLKLVAIRSEPAPERS